MANAANFQLAKTHYKDTLLHEQPGISTPIGICNTTGGRGRSSRPSGVDGDDFTAAAADQHHAVQVLREDLEEFHVCAEVKD